ncbi:hypothetical protein LOK49_LG07G02892 [Camellia lanceoleosa]|uniref:Uncharacterized protein n=1 Tax=Camellia lanceoleosa TaxID=1840588 RepID=A0ACC0H7A8_9ERIC|nr:hypothetical protein LOK49_LG07G02892 [Camellia lanceoleosa]
MREPERYGNKIKRNGNCTRNTDSLTLKRNGPRVENLVSHEELSKILYTFLYSHMGFARRRTLQAQLDLSKELDNQIDQDTIWRYFRQIVEASFVTDGVSVEISGGAGNMAYLAPELIAQEKAKAKANDTISITQSADIFSVGLLLCDLLY